MINISCSFCLVFYFSIALLSACGSGGSDSNSGGSNTNNETGNSQENDPPINNEPPINTVDCTLTVQSLLENLEDTTPSWEQLDCYTQDLARLTRPSFYLQASDQPPEDNSGETDNNNDTMFDWRQLSWRLLQTDMALFEEWPQANIWGYNLQEVPPYLVDPCVGYTADEFDQRLRGMATVSTYLKQQGQLLKVDYFTPPSMSECENINGPTSSSEWLSWWEETYIPERVQIAQMAERIKAEYYQPWDVEPGIMLRSMGEDWFDAMEPAAQTQLAQQAIDSLYEALRPVFSGTLVVIVLERWEFYQSLHSVDYSEWDQVNFVLFTEGDVEATQNYLANQLALYQEMITRDGIEYWVLQELTVNPITHERLLPAGVEFEDIEADIYQAIIDAIGSLELPLNGIGITTGHILTDDAKVLVQAFYDSLASEHQLKVR